MNAHPGGEGHTRHMLEIATLPKGSHILSCLIFFPRGIPIARPIPIARTDSNIPSHI